MADFSPRVIVAAHKNTDFVCEDDWTESRYLLIKLPCLGLVKQMIRSPGRDE